MKIDFDPKTSPIDPDLTRLEKVKTYAPKSTFEKGSSSRAVPEKAGFAPYKSGVALPDFMADPQVRTDAMSILAAKPGRWVRSDLMTALNAACYMAHVCFSVDSINDVQRLQDQYNELDTKYKNSEKQLGKLTHVQRKFENLRDNVIPKKEKTINSQKKEIDDYVAKILGLRKELKDTSFASRKQMEDMQVQLASEIGNVVSSEATNANLKSTNSELERKCAELNNQLTRSKEELESAKKENSELKKENSALLKKAKDLELDKKYQSDQLQKLSFFGTSVFPSLPEDFISDIMTWVDEHPDKKEKNKDALDKLKNDEED